ncbi:MAG: hypothetical protein K1X94_27030 [Sandaracinaceae bacterium]|nr:hypothetical protein [Sandaracinaceae bacterium]
MKKTSSLVCAAAALTAIVGCNNPPAGNDAGSTPDTGMGGNDTGPAVDTGVRNDTGMTSSGGTCAMPIDLNTAGTALTSGTGRTITRSNASAPAGQMSGLANGSCAVNSSGDPTATNEIVFSYTMQGDAFLVVSTDDAATTAADTILWVLEACTATGMELGCSDDNSAGLLSTVASGGEVSAGTTVYIVAASYGMSDTGDIHLTVTEAQPHGAGEDCSDTGLCIADYACVTNAAGDMQTCVQNGTDGGQCRLAAPFCNTGLGCTETAPTADAPGQCQTEIPAGDACSADHFVCVAGATCLRDLGSTTMGHCINDGSDLGLCRTTGMACDTGLTCSEMMPTTDNPGVCQVPVPTGDACTQRHFLCASATATCQLDEGSDTMGHCLEAGSEFGNCRTTGAACDGALVCSVAAPTADNTGTCQTPVAAAGACTERHSVCVDGYSCQLDDMSTDVRHCIADGGDRGECRLAMPFCDSGLTCSEAAPTADMNGVCLAPIASGAVCTAWRFLCVTGSHCIADMGSDTMGHCVLDGTEGAYCRETAPECDTGLTCDPFFGICTAG